MTVHYIYKIQHIASGKAYVGRTIDVERRWKEHTRGSKSSYISCAIQKHGVDAFDFETIDETDEDGVEELERWYIRLHDCVVPRGYNLIDRGEGNCGHHQETREKISRAHMGKVLTEETRARMSASRMGALNPNYGKLGATCKGVTKYTLKGERVATFSSQHLAAEGEKGMASRIGWVCIHRCGTAIGHMWRFSDGAPDALSPHVPTPAATRSVQQLRDGELIATFPSIQDRRGDCGGSTISQHQRSAREQHPQVQGLLVALRGRWCREETQEGHGKWRGSTCGLPFVGDMTQCGHVHAESEC